MNVQSYLAMKFTKKLSLSEVLADIYKLSWKKDKP